MTAFSDLDFAAAFGKRVATAREQRQVSQRLLSAMLAEIGVTLDSAALSRIEQGKRAPKLHEASAIADALHIPLSDLLPPRGPVGLEDLARVERVALEQIDAAMHKLTAVAGYLDYFATLVEANPVQASELWPAGVTTWQEWAEWVADGLIGQDSIRKITPASLSRYHDIERALRFIAEAVLSRPYDPDSDTMDLPEALDDGVDQATP